MIQLEDKKEFGGNKNKESKNDKSNKTLKFIDLFSGIGGFHYAMKRRNSECILASEIDQSAINTYQKNHNIYSGNNIREIEEKNIPDFDVLCAGFPCQAFSKAGKREGFLDDTKGTLFFDIVRILKEKKPKYIILENVRNLVSHDKGNTWKVIVNSLEQLGYRIPEEALILSPHQFGIPQLRERVIIPGVYDPENVDKKLEINFDNLLTKEENDLSSILDDDSTDFTNYTINEKEEKILNIWDDFYKNIKSDTLGFPVWVDVFLGEIVEEKNTPKWKKNFIHKNLELYKENKKFIDEWLKKNDNMKEWHKGFRKFEWQAGNAISSVFEGLIQFRPSGVRVKRPNVAPALVAMVQIPIYGPKKRRLTLSECAKLQSFPKDFEFDVSEQQAYKQLGNSVNVDVISNVLDKLLEY